MPIASMTGYASASGRHGEEGSGVSFTWELRSVNGKGLDIRLRMPSGYEALEQPVRDAAGAALARGNVQIGLAVTHEGAGQRLRYRLNEPLLDGLMEIVRAIELSHGERLQKASLDTVLQIRGILEPVEEAESEAAREARHRAMLAVLESALAALLDARRAEGARLLEVLTGHLDEIAGLIVEARGLAATRPEAIRDRLAQQIAQLLDKSSSLDPQRLYQEAAVLATKADVREELDRLDAHIAEAQQLLTAGGAIGRKLDFLCQEFNREANTVCSKSADVALTRIGLSLKSAVEQFREQVQNIE